MNGKAADRSTHGSPEPLRGWRAYLPSLSQLFWGGLLAVHVPAFWAVWSSLLTEGLELSRLGSGIALVLAMAFFVLKFQDFALLRLRTRQQSIVVVCLLTAVVHHQAIAPGGEGALAVPAAVATVGAVGELARLRPPAARRFLDHLAAQFWARRLVAPSTIGNDVDARTSATDKPPSTSDPRGPPA
jgi:hypothetical protein